MKTILFLALSFTSLLTLASEGDAFTARLYDYEEMGPALSKEVNRRIQKALDKVNNREESHNCDQKVAIKAMEKAFLRPVVGVFEFWSSHTNKVKGHYVKYGDSIYKDLSLKENLPVHLGKLGMATFFKINGTLVASDKFGHFFDEGHTYFEMVHKEGKTIEDAMNKGIDLENGIYGLKRSKVYSYGDLVANRNGYEFWNNLFNEKNGNNILSCEDGKFKINHEFNFADYVDDGWDEGINCSRYADQSTVDRVNAVIQSLEEKSGKHLACPAEKYKCQNIINKYQDEKDFLISPSCL